jgi:lysophospholipase L1-like esterase
MTFPMHARLPSLRILYLLALAITIASAGVAQAHAADPHTWASAIASFKAHDRVDPPPQHGVLFIGSSSIRFWTTLGTDFPGVPSINRGFGGSTIPDSTYYADRIVVPYHPRLIVMYAGDNDVAEGHDASRVLADFKSFVKRVHASLPHVPIVYIAIKHSIARDHLWPVMHRANQRIRAWASTRNAVRFVDMNPAMAGLDGKPRRNLLRKDGLHMTRAGYAIWVKAMKPILAQYEFATH